VGLIYVDSCLLIYFAEGHARWASLVERALFDGTGEVGISPLVKCECLVAPIKRRDPVLRETYLNLFTRFAALAMPEPVYLLAAELRAVEGLKAADALHLACAFHHRCDEFWTNDNRLARGSRGLARNILA
jgi:predicted nucleic acid-binding protein